MELENLATCDLHAGKDTFIVNSDRSASTPTVPTGQHFAWTTDTPTKPGWYWSQMRAGRPHVVELVSELDSGRITIGETGAYVTDLEAENHRWAGPLLPPQGGMMWVSSPPPQG